MAVAVSAAALLVAPGALAHTASFGSQHSLGFSSAGFSGQVTSGLAQCVSGRSVTLYRASASGDSAAATTSTDPQGAWARSATGMDAGSYYAVTTREVLTQRGHKHTCAAARSNTVSVAPDSDGDGVRDADDNCPDVANPGQQDTDHDSRGDACDADSDGDGYSAAQGDCADSDASRHPGAPDNTQNGVDDDCDGSIDEDFYASPPAEYLTAMIAYLQSQVPCSTQLADGTWTTTTGWTSADCRYTAGEWPGLYGSYIEFRFSGPTGDTRSDYYMKPVCWFPSSQSVTAATTWSPSGEFSMNCRNLGGSNLRFTTDTVWFSSAEWIWQYRPAQPSQAVAFQYAGRDWTHFATTANRSVCTCDLEGGGGDGF